MRILLRLFGLIKKYWKWLFLTYVFLILFTTATLIIPQLIGMTIDKGLHIDANTLIVTGDMKLLWVYGFIIIGVSLLRGLFSFGQSYFAEYAGQKVAYDLRNKLYDRIQRLSFAFHDKAQTGQLMSRATQDVEGVRFFLSLVVVRLINLVLIFIAISVILFKMNWQLTIVSFACLPFIAYFAIKFGARMRPLWTKIQQQMAATGIVLQENLSGMRVVKAFSRQKLESDKFEKEAHLLYDSQIAGARIQAVRGPLMTILG